MRFPERKGIAVVAGAPEGADALYAGACAAAAGAAMFVARDDARLYRVVEQAGFFHPGLTVLALPAWDTLPYDRVSPNPEILAERASVLARLAAAKPAAPCLLVTTVNAVLQRLPAPEIFRYATLTVRPGERRTPGELLAYLTRAGFARTGTVREPGEIAVRGGLIDIFPPGAADPVRLDYFGDTLESIRAFDPLSQTSTGPRNELALTPVSELVLDDSRVARFRAGYRALFAEGWREDPLYEAVSARQRFAGMEHWLPLFFDKMATLFDYLPGAAVLLDHQAQQAAGDRFATIADYHQARLDMLAKGAVGAGFVYRPLAPGRLYLDAAEWNARLSGLVVGALSPFEAAGGDIDLGFRPGPQFADARAKADGSLFAAIRAAAANHAARGIRTVVAAHSAGSRARIAHLFAEHGVPGVSEAADWAAALAGPPHSLPVVELPLDRGIVGERLALLTEQDVLGERLVRRSKRRKRSDAFLTELSSLQTGDFVVHADHGIGRYDGLETLSIAGAAHDCLRLVYDGGDKLFLPVENIELLSRYGTEGGTAALDRLGGAGWQSRKARIKQRIRDIADKLLAVAAERLLRTGTAMEAMAGGYDEFAARFPYVETEDQQKAIEEAVADLASGRPMDRLVCGDVGFGKTEVALRAAYVAVMAGHQAAVVVPTTLLARQHYKTFVERFAGLPVRIGRLSRLVSAKEAAETKKAAAEGTADIVVGTHALLGKSVAFKRLGLVVVDEEQHFGVTQKERLKELRADVHVLTLTATPIPRTLQMALAGVRDLSLIATPPVDRLAVRTFVMPYDPVVLREALQRELFRGGQIFYVCPRIEDLDWVAGEVRELVPDAKFALAHGQMAPADLEDVMARFYDAQFQILIATNIIESGLDIPTVNTIVIHRADMFGLAQLYQLRGRVGRSKIRAYAYLTVPPDRKLSDTALRRLEVMQTLDTLGAGFQLASHDMDIRGAGNLLGEEQSGHIREVGIELYQQMLEEAVAAAKERGTGAAAEAWTPQIAIGTPVLIPEAYVADLHVRLGLYRRVSDLVDAAEIDAFAAELVDRFGSLPAEVQNLLDIVAIKRLCLKAGIEKLDAGPKGAVLAFRGNRFARPERLVRFIGEQAGTVKLRPDQKIVYRRDWSDPTARLKGVSYLVRQIADMAA